MNLAGLRRCAAFGLTCVLWLALTQAVLARAIKQAEMRIDGGEAQALSLMATNSRAEYWEGDFALAVSTTNFSIGPHWLEVRMQGDNAVWSAWQGQWFRIAGEPRLISAEWFVDQDPGPGKGQVIPLPVDGVWDEAEEELVIGGVEAAELSVGRHTMFIRCQDSDGNWGLTSQTVFYVGDPLYMVAAEWTTDPNSEPGTGYPLRAVDGRFDEAEEDLVATGTADQLGAVCSTPSLYVRIKDSLGRWSTRQGLYWSPAAPEPGGEWKFDPRVGWATAVIPDIPLPPGIPANPSPSDLAFVVDAQVTLRWDRCPGASNYDLRFWRQGKPVTRFELQGEANSLLAIPPASLVAAGGYCWQVRSVSANGCYIEGPVWRFMKPGPGDADGDGMADDWEAQYFGWISTADVTTDQDGDGIFDWEEYRAGTNPTNSIDYFQVKSVEMLFPPSGLRLGWDSVAERRYAVYSTDRLMTPCEEGREPGRMYPVCSDDVQTVWTKVYEIAGNGATLSYTNALPGPSGRFFQIEVGLTDDP